MTLTTLFSFFFVLYEQVHTFYRIIFPWLLIVNIGLSKPTSIKHLSEIKNWPLSRFTIPSFEVLFSLITIVLFKHKSNNIWGQKHHLFHSHHYYFFFVFVYHLLFCYYLFLIELVFHYFLFFHNCLWIFLYI